MRQPKYGVKHSQSVELKQNDMRLKQETKTWIQITVFFILFFLVVGLLCSCETRERPNTNTYSIRPVKTYVVTVGGRIDTIVADQPEYVNSRTYVFRLRDTIVGYYEREKNDEFTFRAISE